MRASPERLTQVFENLRDNAASFSPAGGMVEVRLIREDGSGLVLVDDRGPGIPSPTSTASSTASSATVRTSRFLVRRRGTATPASVSPS